MPKILMKCYSNGENIVKRTRSLVVSELRSETKGSRFEVGC